MLQRNSTVYVAGHTGMVGSAIVRALRNGGYTDIVTRSHGELDLIDQAAVREFFTNTPIDYVVMAAARVGGILANDTYPADFIYDNLMMEANVIHEAFTAGVRGLFFMGSACIYPKLADQPMSESALLSGPLEPTNEPYAVAKIAGIKLCESYNRQHGTDFRSAMPNNLYGPNDTYDDQNSHVIPALIQRVHRAKVEGHKSVTVWGTGQVRREFLHVDDLASASLFLMTLEKAKLERCVKPMQSHVNIGSGSDITIRDLAETIRTVVGYDGMLDFDTSKPDGTPRKLLDSSILLGMGWRPQIDLRSGLESTYRDFLARQGA